YGTNFTELNRQKSQRAADTIDDKDAVTHGQDPLQIGAVDLHIGETGPALEVVELWHQRLDLRHRRDGAAIRDAAGLRDADKIGDRGSMADLPAGFAIGLVVEH